MGSIPHGVTVLMQGPNPGMKPTHGKPKIPHLKPFSTPWQRVSGAQSHALPRALPRYEPAAPAPDGNPEPAGCRDPTNKPRRRPSPPPGPLPAGSQHDVPEININADVLVPNQPPVGTPPPPLPAGSALSYQSTGPYPEHFQHFIDDPNHVSGMRSTTRISLASSRSISRRIPNRRLASRRSALAACSRPSATSRSWGSLTKLKIRRPLPSQSPAPYYQPATLAIQPNTTPNAFVYSASATFWIEWVRNPGEPTIPLHEGPGEPCPPVRELEPYWEHSTYFQLQYSQLVILIFNNVLWPHVTVATMILSDG